MIWVATQNSWNHPTKKNRVDKLTYWCWNILRAKYLCCSWRRRSIDWTAALNPYTLLYCAGYQKNWKNSCEIIKIKRNRLRHNFVHMQRPHAYSHPKKKPLTLGRPRETWHQRIWKNDFHLMKFIGNSNRLVCLHKRSRGSSWHSAEVLSENNSSM